MSVKVLFVDDEEGNLLVSEAVCGDDFDVLTARGGAVALELMRAYEVGVIVCDQRMPEMSGVELLEKVQAEFPDTVRLLVTAYSDIGAAIDAINRGRVRRYLKKPWEPEELKAEVADALERYQTRRRLRELERRLIQTERVYALGIVAAGIGHELRNPISWITTNLQHSLAELGELSEALKANDAPLAGAKVDEIRAALQDATMGAERVAEIVSAIQLSMVRPSGESEIVDLEEVVHLSLRLVEGELRRACKLDLQVSGSPRVRGSRTQLSQIVVNLLINAIHAVSKLPPAEAVIAVRIGTDGKLASLEVADNGSGVPDADRERIFDPFFTTKPGVGTGLGLAISRKIAAELSGSLEVERDGRLGGAVFRLTLPTQPAGARER
jgi:C4-dicarboxylate-specific signal transduction histidine kinase